MVFIFIIIITLLHVVDFFKSQEGLTPDPFRAQTELIWVFSGHRHLSFVRDNFVLFCYHISPVHTVCNPGVATDESPLFFYDFVVVVVVVMVAFVIDD